MRSMKTLKTQKEVVKALGGLRATGELFGIGESAVGNWLYQHGNFPAYTMTVIQQELLSRGMSADTKLWNFDRKRRKAGAA